MFAEPCSGLRAGGENGPVPALPHVTPLQVPPSLTCLSPSWSLRLRARLLPPGSPCLCPHLRVTQREAFASAPVKCTPVRNPLGRGPGWHKVFPVSGETVGLSPPVLILQDGDENAPHPSRWLREPVTAPAVLGRGDLTSRFVLDLFTDGKTGRGGRATRAGLGSKLEVGLRCLCPDSLCREPEGNNTAPQTTQPIKRRRAILAVPLF